MDEVHVPPPVQMVQMLAGFQLSQALYVAAKLGVADQILDEPRPVAEIASAVGARPVPLARLMRTLASTGVFIEVEPDRFGITPRGATLATDQPGSLVDFALMWMETHYLPFSRLLDTVTSETPAADLYYEQKFFDWLSQDPGQAARFSRAMANFTSGIKAEALADLDISSIDRLVDVGGADGTLLTMVLPRSPSTSAVLFDLPHVVAGAPKVIADAGLTDRVELVGGDFFSDALPKADGYIMSLILHDWSDEEGAQILRNIASAGGSGAHLVLVEFVVPPGDTPHMAKAIDLTMLGMLTGRERSEPDWRALLDAAGFDSVEVVETPTPISRIHASVK